MKVLLSKLIHTNIFTVSKITLPNIYFQFGFKNTSDPNDSVRNKYKQLPENVVDKDFDIDLIINSKDPLLSKYTQNISKEDFNKKSSYYLNSLSLAFQSIDDTNITLEELNDTTLTIKAGKIGNYIFTIDSDQLQITMNSPVSGYFKYYYNKTNGFWCNIKDEHILDDLLIREFCKHSKGILTIEYKY